jgi:hypothetical protein
MPFIRGVISKACFFCKLLKDISKKGGGTRCFQPIIALEVEKNIGKKKFAKKTKFQKVLIKKGGYYA